MAGAYTCQFCGGVFPVDFMQHSCPGPMPAKAKAPEQEMLSLKLLREKLDTVLESQGRLAARLDSLAEVVVNMNGFLHGLQMRLDGGFKGIADGLGLDLAEIRGKEQEHYENIMRLVAILSTLKPTRKGGPQRAPRRCQSRNTRVPGRNKRPKQS